MLTKQAENFAKWYQDIVREAGLSEPSEVRGCGIVKPYGYKIWELIRNELARLIEATGAENVYFPMFIPMSNLETEKEHVEGFAPELAVVTHGGGQELTEKLAVRPTSETGMYKAYAKWIESYRDLPLRLNQWCNVVRWEKRPRAFLRWSEFLWQEGHTAFATKEEALKEMWQMLDIYEQIYKFIAVPVIKGKKSQMEKFAGAEITSCVEAMAKDGKSIQGATSHHLGQNFSKAFNVKFVDADGKEQYVYQNSWGFTWRSIGALIMTHGDDKGLRLPPSVAPIQVVIVPIFRDDNKDKVFEYVSKIENTLKVKYRVKSDLREGLSPGFKFNEWELKGVPVRLEIGEQEMNNNRITVFRRDLNTKDSILVDELEDTILKLFEEIPNNLFNQAKQFSDSHIHEIKSIDEIKDQVGYFKASWCESVESEKLLKEKFSMVSRVLPIEWESKPPTNSKCFITGAEAKHDWLFAKSY